MAARPFFMRIGNLGARLSLCCHSRIKCRLVIQRNKVFAPQLNVLCFKDAASLPADAAHSKPSTRRHFHALLAALLSRFACAAISRPTSA